MVTEIVPNVYDITCKEVAGSRYRVFLFTEQTPTLFDTGFADSDDVLFDAIDEIGVEPERLIITHGDPDHVGAFDAVVDQYDLTSYVPEQTTLETKSPADTRFRDGDAIGRFTAIHVPGHEPDNYVLLDEDSGIAVMGDAVSGSDQRGLPSGYFVLPPASYSVDLNLAETSLEALVPYEFETALLFHGSSVLTNASEKLERFVNFPGKPA